VIALALVLVAAAQEPAPRFEAWNLAYTPPAGWQMNPQPGRVHAWTSSSAQNAVIYVGPGMYQTFNDVGADLNKGFVALGLTGTPTGQPATLTIGGMQAMSADYVGQNQMGIPLQARAVAVLTPHGTGLIVLGLSAYGQIAPVAAAVDRIAQSLQALGPPQPNHQIVAGLRGRWMFYAGKADGTTSALGGSSRSHEEFVEFDGAGRFSYQSSSSVMVTTPGLTGSAGGAQSNSDEGSYTVVGTTLVLRGRQGQMSFELQVLPDRLIADGRTFVRAN
jgi:hypothetical protein